MTPTAAEHMTTAFRAIFAENSCPTLRKFAGGGVMINTGEQDPFGNFGAGLDLQSAEEVATKLSGEQFPAMIISPGPRVTEFEDKITPHGFVHAAQIPGMVIPIHDLKNPEMAEGYSFVRVTSVEDAPEWSQVLAEAYPVAQLASDAMSPVHVKLSDAPDAAVQFFAVKQSGKIVGVSALVLGDGLAGVYCVATLKEHRRQGIGAVLAARPLLAAGEVGYEKAVLQASADGYNVYKRLGFVDSGEVQLYMKLPAGTSMDH